MRFTLVIAILLVIFAVSSGCDNTEKTVKFTAGLYGGTLAIGPAPAREVEMYLDLSDNSSHNWTVNLLGTVTAKRRLILTEPATFFENTALVESTWDEKGGDVRIRSGDPGDNSSEYVLDMRLRSSSGGGVLTITSGRVYAGNGSELSLAGTLSSLSLEPGWEAVNSQFLFAGPDSSSAAPSMQAEYCMDNMNYERTGKLPPLEGLLPYYQMENEIDVLAAELAAAPESMNESAWISYFTSEFETRLAAVDPSANISDLTLFVAAGYGEAQDLVADMLTDYNARQILLGLTFDRASVGYCDLGAYWVIALMRAGTSGPCGDVSVNGSLASETVGPFQSGRAFDSSCSSGVDLSANFFEPAHTEWTFTSNGELGTVYLNDNDDYITIFIANPTGNGTYSVPAEATVTVIKDGDTAYPFTGVTGTLTLDVCETTLGGRVEGSFDVSFSNAMLESGDLQAVFRLKFFVYDD